MLDTLRNSLTVQQRGVRDRVLVIANEHGTDDLAPLYQMKVQEENRYEDELQRIALDLAVAQASADPVPTTGPASQPAVTIVTREDVAAIDPQMRDWVSQEDALTSQLSQLQAVMGEKNIQVVLARAKLEGVSKRIDNLVATYQARGGIPRVLANAVRGGGMSVPALQTHQADVRKLYEKVHAESLDLGRKRLQIQNLKREESMITQRLDEVTARIEQVNLEATNAGRVSILNYGERPTTPLKSKRLPMTAAAGVGGMAAGVGIVLLWGFLDRRVRSVLQVQQMEPAMRMLGVLPILPEGLADAEQKSMAAHCVHHIRNLLSAGDHGAGRVLAITSPTAGDGKTSLTLALGLSFAAAGFRTLLIDADIIGGGLTGRLNAIARRGIGSFLRRQGLIDDVQLREARNVSTSRQCELAEALLELGYVTEAQVRAALAAEDQNSVGLLDALDGDELATCITPILAKNLSILPLGEAAAHHTSQLSPKAVRRILAEAREMFDVVIVDTGPVLGSLEASIIVREVDEVVLAVARDARSPIVKRAVALLGSLGVRFAGMVFNRATPGDVAFAHYGSSSSTASIRSVQAARNTGQKGSDSPTRALRLGSLAAAVAGSSRNGSANEAHNHDHAD